MLEKIQETVVSKAIDEGFIIEDTVAIDATHFEARDQAPTKKEYNASKLASDRINVNVVLKHQLVA